MDRRRSRDRSRSARRSRSRSRRRRSRRHHHRPRHRHQSCSTSRSASERRTRRRSRSGGRYRNHRHHSRSRSRSRYRSWSWYRRRRPRSSRSSSYSSSERSRSYSSTQRSSSTDRRTRRRRRRRGSCDRRQSSSSYSSSSSSTWSQLASDSADDNLRPERDDEGHLIFKPGDKIRKYEIRESLGEGTFGKVALCNNTSSSQPVALKIIKNIEKYRESAKIEVGILKDLQNHDHLKKYNCVEMLDCFNYCGHICIVLEPLGLSLYDFMKRNKYRGYPLQQIRHIGYQVLRALKYVHHRGLTHTDLKPENILFVDSSCDVHYDLHLRQNISIVRDSTVRLIDFGSATYEDDHHSRVVATRHYRSPEVILEMGWSYPLDVWSLGCILFELYTGKTLFQTHSNREHLAMMESYLSPIPRHFAAKSRRRKYFHRNRLVWDRHSTEGDYVRKTCKPLLHYMSVPDPDVSLMFELIQWMLNYEPDRRCTAAEALRHRFFEMFRS